MARETDAKFSALSDGFAGRATTTGAVIGAGLKHRAVTCIPRNTRGPVAARPVTALCEVIRVRVATVVSRTAWGTTGARRFDSDEVLVTACRDDQRHQPAEQPRPAYRTMANAAGQPKPA